MHIAELWHYPIKSMAGQLLQEANVTEMGLAGDRLAYVVNNGVVLTARNYPELLLQKGGLDDQGQPTVNNLPWNHPEISKLITQIGGENAHLILAQAGERFDILPLLVATDGAIQAQNTDRRRFRPNILIGGVEGQAERQWQGKALKIGDAIISLAYLRQRCVMTTWDPDTIAQDKSVLLKIIANQEGTLALNAWTAVPGKIAVGDPVELIEDFEAGEPNVRGRFVLANQ